MIEWNEINGSHHYPELALVPFGAPGEIIDYEIPQVIVRPHPSFVCRLEVIAHGHGSDKNCHQLIAWPPEPELSGGCDDFEFSMCGDQWTQQGAPPLERLLFGHNGKPPH